MALGSTDGDGVGIGVAVGDGVGIADADAVGVAEALGGLSSELEGLAGGAAHAERPTRTLDAMRSRRQPGPGIGRTLTRTSAVVRGWREFQQAVGHAVQQ